MRRAMAIQLVINREWGLAKNENPNQGSFIIDELTDLVEEAVLKEFEAISERGGVLGAMETGYQRGKIQEESLYYEHKKHDGSLPDHRRQHLPQSARRRGAARSSSSSARPTTRSSRSSKRLRDFHERNAKAGAGGAREAAAGGDRGRERLRGADGRGARLLARPDHARAVRGGRAVPAQHVTPPMRKTPHGWRLFDAERPILIYEYSFGPGIANALAVRGSRGLVVVSPPCRVEPGVFDDLVPYGKVVALVASNAFHHMGLREWKARFPEAAVFAPAQAVARVEKRSKLSGIRPLAEARAVAGEGLELVDMPHYKTGEVLVRIATTRGLVWYVTDIIMNLRELPANPVINLMFRLSRAARACGSITLRRCSWSPTRQRFGAGSPTNSRGRHRHGSSRRMAIRSSLPSNPDAQRSLLGANPI